MMHLDHGKATVNKENASFARFLYVCFENKRNFSVQGKEYT